MVRIGVVLLPQERWATARSRWRAAEEMGFDHAWTYDHLAWRDLADEPWFATVPLLAAAAAVTDRIGLGTWVASPNFRHPVPFAKDVMGLDDVSGGRFLLGVGAGGEGWDAGVLGPAPSRAERTQRFAEFLGLLDKLLTQEVTDHDGAFYQARGARMVPGTIARPRTPFVVAANGPRAMALAARYGQGWATFGPGTGVGDGADAAAAQEAWWDGLARMADAFDEAADGRDVGRWLSLDGAPRFSLTSAALAVEGVERAAALGFGDVVVHWPRPSGVYAGDERELERFAAEVPRLQALEPAAR
ncbi:LLM class flavin-dependent oxidoreductase [Cellulomonas wangsupingiae]|uniref:LLM class flavin-dependent oxidoreductase n=1 Tax=Cellulomonas wangsupingiae TaxID=2968085 RepID=A0ABY5K3U5_9CELL|nr:LLM class flavin-dependent oxidoreductase [Cellulomonas wangsupingiae]MCC2335390.1 LLM class flavin-dependent oxidoreductase [Cellulomonas wangsupingiae]MCM0640078.1 LLM class flavin-dependent oxidoreductase [Cellulomonas wangsupingiae]UUI64434.1 LLM class flavin-dependent oxidoreductase [Cellulomonas wangsupingiae]